MKNLPSNHYPKHQASRNPNHSNANNPNATHFSS